jgi:surface antigen
VLNFGRLVAVASLAAATLLSGASSAANTRGGDVVVYGYSWASRCPAAGQADKIDRWRMYACNCTSYVAWALDANGQRTDWFIPGAMNAWNWPHIASLSEIETGLEPRIGAVAVWPTISPPFGHIAYVTAVHADRTFDAAEYNLGPLDGFTPYTFDVRTGLLARGAIFIYVPHRL